MDRLGGTSLDKLEHSGGLMIYVTRRSMKQRKTLSDCLQSSPKAFHCLSLKFQLSRGMWELVKAGKTISKAK